SACRHRLRLDLATVPSVYLVVDAREPVRGIVRLAMASVVELDGGLGHQLALIARDSQLLGRRLTRAIATRDGRSTVRRATVGFRNVEELADTVAGGQHDHSAVSQGAPGGINGNFLAAAIAVGSE